MTDEDLMARIKFVVDNWDGDMSSKSYSNGM